MKKSLITILLLLLPSLCFGATLTTNNGTTGLSGWGGSSSAAGDRYWIAQKFTTVGACTATDVAISNAYTATAQSNNASVVVDVEADSSGHPSNTSLATGSTLYSSYKLYDGTTKFATTTFNASVALSAATTYWIVMHPSVNMGSVTAFVTGGNASPVEELSADSVSTPSWVSTGDGQTGLVITCSPAVVVQSTALNMCEF